jgi:hypothetical protein
MYTGISADPRTNGPNVPKMQAEGPRYRGASPLPVAAGFADDEREIAARKWHTTKGKLMRVKNWLKTVPTLAIIGSVLFLVLSVGSGLLLYGANFSHNMVHNQLADQKISFPPKGSAGLDPKEFPGLQRYAGQAVDNGPKAKAYADQFINAHLKGIGGGQTYSQLSAQAQASPNDAALAAKVQTLFRGETLRGLLLYAWGWSVVSEIAYFSGIAAALGAIVVLFALALGFFAHEREVKRHAATSRSPSTSTVSAAAASAPVSVTV